MRRRHRGDDRHLACEWEAASHGGHIIEFRRGKPKGRGTTVARVEKADQRGAGARGGRSADAWRDAAPSVSVTGHPLTTRPAPARCRPRSSPSRQQPPGTGPGAPSARGSLPLRVGHGSEPGERAGQNVDAMMDGGHGGAHMSGRRSPYMPLRGSQAAFRGVCYVDAKARISPPTGL